MTIPQQRQAIREACIQANPSILELKFGCKISFNASTNPINHKYENVEISCVGKDEFYDDKKYNIAFYSFSEKFVFHPYLPNLIGYKILGRDIRLADVLLMFAEKKLDLLASPSFQKKGFAVILPSPESKLRERPEPTYCYWNLLNDSLDLQSDTTIEFLYQLIKEK